MLNANSRNIVRCFLPMPVIVLWLMLASVAFSQTEESRVWTDSTGKHKIKAQLLNFDGKTVKLLKEDGKETSLPLARLSQLDQKFLADLAKRNANPKGEGESAPMAEPEKASTKKARNRDTSLPVVKVFMKSLGGSGGMEMDMGAGGFGDGLGSGGIGNGGRPAMGGGGVTGAGDGPAPRNSTESMSLGVVFELNKELSQVAVMVGPNAKLLLGKSNWRIEKLDGTRVEVVDAIYLKHKGFLILRAPQLSLPIGVERGRGRDYKEKQKVDLHAVYKNVLNKTVNVTKTATAIEKVVKLGDKVNCTLEDSLSQPDAFGLVTTRTGKVIGFISGGGVVAASCIPNDVYFPTDLPVIAKQTGLATRAGSEMELQLAFVYDNRLETISSTTKFSFEVIRKPGDARIAFPIPAEPIRVRKIDRAEADRRFGIFGLPEGFEVLSGKVNVEGPNYSGDLEIHGKLFNEVRKSPDVPSERLVFTIGPDIKSTGRMFDAIPGILNNLDQPFALTTKITREGTKIRNYVKAELPSIAPVVVDADNKPDVEKFKDWSISSIKVTSQNASVPVMSGDGSAVCLFSNQGEIRRFELPSFKETLLVTLSDFSTNQDNGGMGMGMGMGMGGRSSRGGGRGAPRGVGGTPNLGYSKSHLVYSNRQGVLVLDPVSLEAKSWMPISGVIQIACSINSDTMFALTGTQLWMIDLATMTPIHKVDHARELEPGFDRLNNPTDKISLIEMSVDGNYLMSVSGFLSCFKITGSELEFVERSQEFIKSRGTFWQSDSGSHFAVVGADIQLKNGSGNFASEAPPFVHVFETSKIDTPQFTFKVPSSGSGSQSGGGMGGLGSGPGGGMGMGITRYGKTKPFEFDQANQVFISSRLGIFSGSGKPIVASPLPDHLGFEVVKRIPSTGQFFAMTAIGGMALITPPDFSQMDLKAGRAGIVMDAEPRESTVGAELAKLNWNEGVFKVTQLNLPPSGYRTLPNRESSFGQPRGALIFGSDPFVEWSPDGKYLFVATPEGFVQKIDSVTASVVGEFDLRVRISGFDQAASGLLLIANEQQEIHIVDIDSMELIRKIDIPLLGLARASMAHDIVCVTTQSGYTELHDLESGERLVRYARDSDSNAYSIDEDFQRMAPPTGKTLNGKKFGLSIKTDFSLDGKLILGNCNNNTCLFELKDNRLFVQRTFPATTDMSFTFTPSVGFVSKPVAPWRSEFGRMGGMGSGGRSGGRGGRAGARTGGGGLGGGLGGGAPKQKLSKEEAKAKYEALNRKARYVRTNQSDRTMVFQLSDFQSPFVALDPGEAGVVWGVDPQRGVTYASNDRYSLLVFDKDGKLRYELLRTNEFRTARVFPSPVGGRLFVRNKESAWLVDYPEKTGD